jgi:NSS family neurotransmitter:Na+ symporter
MKKVDGKSFIITSLGAVMGLGNALRFPSLSFKYGGAFIIAYAITLLFICMPVLCAELKMGKSSNKNFPQSLRGIAVIGEGVGYAACLNSLYIALYYSAIVAFLLQMAINIFPQCIGGGNLSYFFFDNILPSESNEIAFSPQILISLALCWVVLYLVLSGAFPLKSSAKFAVTLQVVLFVTLAARGLAYSNSGSALYALFVPNFNKLLSADIWAEALSQSLLSLSLAAGVMPAFGKSMPKNLSPVRAAAQILCANFLGCILSAVAMFTSLYGCGLQVGMANGGLLFAFCVYPAAIAKLFNNAALCGIFGTLFYLSLLFTALQSTLSLLSAVTSLRPQGEASNKFALILCTAGFIFSCAFSTKAAYPALVIADGYACLFIAPIIAAAECLLFIVGAHKKIISMRKFICVLFYAVGISSFLLAIRGVAFWLFACKGRAFYQFKIVYEAFFGWTEGVAVLSTILIIPAVRHIARRAGGKSKIWKTLKS